MVQSLSPLILLGLVFLWTLRGEGSTVCVWRENCILPCTFSFGKDILIHWYYDSTQNVHSYYDNRDQVGQQISRFQKRTSLFHEEIPRGNASLLLMRVQVEDQGTYLCYTSTISDSSRKNIDLEVEALVREVNVVRVNDSITCSSERIYPEPTLSWSIDPQQAHRPEVQVTEDGLYSISSTVVVNGSSNQNYSCTVSTGRSSRKTTLFPLRQVNTSGDETTISCSRLNTRVTQLTWRFNGAEIIVTGTGTAGGHTPSDRWSKHVKQVSQSGDLQLQQLTPSQEGTFTCELSGDEETHVTVTELTYSVRPDGGLGAGAKAGIVIGVLIVAAGIGVVCYCKRKRKREENGQNTLQNRPLRGKMPIPDPDEIKAEPPVDAALMEN